MNAADHVAWRKAENFGNVATSNGWDVRYEVKSPDVPEPFLYVYCERGTPGKSREKVSIFWEGTRMHTAPRYYWNDEFKWGLHNTADAKKQLAGKPDMKRLLKSAQSKAKKGMISEDDPLITEGFGEITDEQRDLPFDIWESSDAEILKAVRGSTILVLNSISRRTEAIHIPKEKNRNLKHFRIDMNKAETKPILHFIEGSGVFRSVHLESILRVG